MDEAWERAVEAALEGQAAESSSSSSSPRTLNLDGAVKCLHGRLPPPSLFEKFQNLEHLSIANVGVSSLEKFPRLRNLQRLILSDNRIAGGLEFLVEAGLESLRDLDLSNNRIQFLEDLAPLAQLRLVSLDLYECPVTRVKDYRSRVFGMIRSLKYLDKMDADENERPESDEEEEDDDEEEEEDEIDGDDPGSGEIDGEDRGRKAVNGVGGSGDGVGVVDVDEDESDADEEETETGGRREANGSHQHHSNGFRVAAVGEEVDEDGDEVEEEDVDDEEDEEYDEEDGDDDEMGEEIDADDGEDEDVVEVHDVVDSDEDGVHEEQDDEDNDEVDDDDDADEDEVEDEEEEGEPGSTGRLMSAEGEIDGHEQGEEDENENGELGEADEEGVEEDRHSEDDEEEDADGEYLVQPIPQPDRSARAGGDSDACDEDEEEVDDEDTRPSNGSIPSQPSSSQHSKCKRKRDDNSDLADDSVKDVRSSKH